MQMPEVPDLESYRRIYHRDEIWRPVIEAVCSRYSCLDAPCVRGPDGTHIVYMVGANYVVKLYTPLFPDDFQAERRVAQFVVGKLGVETPEIVAEGQIGGWDYLILVRIAGIPLDSVWTELTNKNRREIAAEVGCLIARLHDLPVAGLEALETNWIALQDERVADLVAHHPPVPELAWEPREEISRFFTSLPVLWEMDSSPVLLLSDITREHVFVEWYQGLWRMTGYLDFGDSVLGPPDYEIVAPGLEIAGGDAQILRTLLLAAGYPEDTLDEHLSRKLMAYTLLNRFIDLNDVLASVPRAHLAADLEEMARLVWPV